MHLFMAAPDAASAAGVLQRMLARFSTGVEADRIRATRDLWRTSEGAWEIVKSTLTGLDHQTVPLHDIAHWSKAFDRAARISPAAGVALYSLGSERLLEQITAQVVGRMREWDLVDSKHVLLEIGCGAGRFVSALATNARLVLGIDISNAMLRLARERCCSIANARFIRTSGHHLAAFADSSMDLVYAIDCFPYLVLTNPDLAVRHVSESARVLRPGGRLLIFNYSYRGSSERDRCDIAELADTFGLRLIRNGTQDLSLWDGLAFLLEKPG
jgi:ubiquinone/menaquinone biosynthesis C-methylase UbiE